MRRRGRPPHADILTPREWEVLALLRDGLTNEQIAARLDISLATAKYHVSEILSKLGVTTREEAAAWQEPRRPWWRALLLWPSLKTGVAATVVVLAVVGIVLWGLLSADGEQRPSVLSLPTATTISTPSPTPKAIPTVPVPALTPPGPEQEEPVTMGAFGWRRGLYSVHPDTGELRLFLTPSTWRYDWSPDGRYLAHVPFPPTGIHFMSAGAEPLGSIPLSDIHSVDGLWWSPDGSRIALRVEVPTPDPPFGEVLVGAVGMVHVAAGRMDILYKPPEGFNSSILGWAGERLVVEESQLHTGSAGKKRAFYLDLDGSKESIRPVPEGELSPDGRLVAYSESGGHLTVAPVDGSYKARELAATGHSASWSPDRQWLAFESKKRIWVVNVDGTGKRQLAPGLQPSWSPDGSRIAYVREGNVYVIGVDGSGETKLTDITLSSASTLRWSPDGRLMFAYAALSSEVVTVDPDGGNRVLLVPGAYPQWSPDGERLAVVAATFALGFSGSIHLMQPDGSGIVRLAATVSRGDVGPVCDPLYQWSADGEMIFFVGDGMLSRIRSDGSGRAETLVRALDFFLSGDGKSVAYSTWGPEQKVYIRDLQSGSERKVADGSCPAWSSDGRYLAYESEGGLRILDLVTGTSRSVVLSPFTKSWSPTGASLAVASDGGIYIVDAAGAGPPRRLAEGHGLAWSSDSRYLAFSSGESNEDLWVIPADGSSEPWKIGKGYAPSWSPDGSRIAYAK